MGGRGTNPPCALPQAKVNERGERTVVSELPAGTETVRRSLKAPPGWAGRSR